ncbi:MAG: Ig-like domain-containing protein [Clostridiales Family XIII bacterium]|jgi:hypothetical protein|nr:Ig-like domain-containing protein [Clostridiales Family XIII bacterium]
MRDRKKLRIGVIVLVVVLVAALTCTYVLSIADLAYATEDDGRGGGGMIDLGVDDEGYYVDANGQRVLDANGEPIKAAEAPEAPFLNITSPPATMDVGTQTVLYLDTNLPEGSVIYWESSDPDVVTVGENGLVTAVAPGEAWIRAIAEEVRSSEIEITVNQPPPTGVKILCDESALSGLESGKTVFDIKIGDVFNDFSYELIPAGARQQGSPEWSLSNPDVATWNNSRKEFIATGAGETDLVLTIDGVSARITFRITENENLFAVYGKRILPYAIALVIVIVIVAVLISMANKEKEKRAKAAARKRRAEQERAERERLQRQQQEAVPYSPVDGRASLIHGQGVGARRVDDTIQPNGDGPPPDRPFTLDDIE